MRQTLPPLLRVLERGWVSSNNIVFLGKNDTALVDTGYGSHAEQTLALVQLALAGRSLERIVNTHTHSDHIGGNAVLQRAYPGVHTTIPLGEADVITRWDDVALHLGPMGQACERFGFDATFDAGDTLTLGDLPWRVLGSPGHDMESLMLYCEAERVLISADALWENGFGILFPELTGEAAPGRAFEAQRATLALIEGLEIDWVIPGHGAPFTDVRGALTRAQGRLDYLAADPRRNARNAAKVALSFVLMIEGRLLLADLQRKLAGMALVGSINQRYLQLDDAALTDYLVAELEKSRAARRENGWLVPVAPQ